jgi:tetratricopeptide (TPR) repeat protein
MWLWLLIALGSSNFSLAPAYAVDTSNGPTSQQEASILWSDGQKAFESGNYQDAVNNLSRLVDRYPGSPGYLEAHRLLGRSFMLLGRYSEALAPLQAYIADTGTSESGLDTRLWLGDVYLKLAQANEAYLTSQEIEKLSKSSYPGLYARSQFLKARALLALNQDDRASRVIDSVEALPAVQSDPTLKGYAAQARIELKLRRCALFPSAGPMEEQQARDQFNRRGLCLQEALVLFKTAAESRELITSDETANELFKGFESYTAATRKPPAPPKLKPKDRTPKQRSEYLSELAYQLNQDRQKAIHDSLATLEEWKEKAASPSQEQAASTYAKLTKKIETLL